MAATMAAMTATARTIKAPNGQNFVRFIKPPVHNRENLGRERFDTTQVRLHTSSTSYHCWGIDRRLPTNRKLKEFNASRKCVRVQCPHAGRASPYHRRRSRQE